MSASWLVPRFAKRIAEQRPSDVVNIVFETECETALMEDLSSEEVDGSVNSDYWEECYANPILTTVAVG